MRPLPTTACFQHWDSAPVSSSIAQEDFQGPASSLSWQSAKESIRNCSKHVGNGSCSNYSVKEANLVEGDGNEAEADVAHDHREAEHGSQEGDLEHLPFRLDSLAGGDAQKRHPISAQCARQHVTPYQQVDHLIRFRGRARVVKFTLSMLWLVFLIEKKEEQCNGKFAAML